MARIVTISAEELGRRQRQESGSSSPASGSPAVAVQLRIVGYLTAKIEDLAEGDWLISRDQDDSDGPLVAGRIARKYRRVADHLELVGTEDAAGERQTLKTTDEHPFYVAGRGWTKSKLLEVGDRLSGPAEAGSSVTANVRQSHPEGVVVYNMEVEGTHSYFVRAEGSMAEPVWVHNGDCGNVAEYEAYKRRLALEEASNPGNTMRGTVVLDDPVGGATAAQQAQIREYAALSTLAEREGYLSTTGRVSTKGAMRADASRAAAVERALAEAEGVPYEGVVGHGPDTTWTARPEAPFWQDLDSRINSSLGRQAQNYPIGFRPTRFVYRGDL